MANFLAQKRQNHFQTKESCGSYTPENKTKTVAQDKTDATLSAASSGSVGPSVKQKSSWVPQCAGNAQYQL